MNSFRLYVRAGLLHTPRSFLLINKSIVRRRMNSSWRTCRPTCSCWTRRCWRYSGTCSLSPSSSLRHVQPDQINTAVLFWFLVKSDAIVRYCTLAYTGQDLLQVFLQATRNTRPCITCHTVQPDTYGKFIKQTLIVLVVCYVSCARHFCGRELYYKYCFVKITYISPRQASVNFAWSISCCWCLAMIHQRIGFTRGIETL